MTNRNISGEIAFAASQYTKEREYWLEKLAGIQGKNSFPTDFNAAGNNKAKTGAPVYETLSFEFPPGLTSKLVTVMNGSDSRLYMILVAGLFHLLYKYTGDTDVIIGIPIDKQSKEGVFINTVLALRVGIKKDLTFRELLMDTRRTISEAKEHLNYPIETLPYELNLASLENDFPLFDMAVLLENIHDKAYISHIPCNIVISFRRVGESFEGKVEFNPLLYEKATILRICTHFRYLLAQALNSADSTLDSLSALSSSEKEQLLFEFNRASAPYPQDTTIYRLFEQQVEKNPGNSAVEDDEKKWTYNTLNQKAGQLACRLRALGMGPGTVAAVMGERKVEIIAGILGVLKVGAAYLPIDEKNPDERITYIIKDSGARVFLTQTHLIDNKKDVLRSFSPENIFAVDDECNYSGKPRNADSLSRPGDPVYIIYTSGTTGNPKGVVVEHRGLVDYIWWAAKQYVKGEKVNFPLYTSLAFDLAVTSLFTPLITGNSVVLYSGNDTASLIEKIIDDDNVGVVKLTPSHLKLLGNKVVTHTNIKRLIVGGEELDTQSARDIHANFCGNVEIYNEYGPTEAIVGCMIHKFDPQTDNRHSVPIGIPADNARIYILNGNLEPVPMGVEGEIYISGDGLARGYLGRPGLTHEKFIPNPFITGKKMYKTGDLARMPANGNIEFIGRNDDQVKVRGYRIELGEIENRLLRHNDITQVVVIMKEFKRGNTENENRAGSLPTAYIVSDRQFSVSELRDYLSEQLPGYMIPSYFMQVEKIPLTVGGKVDKNRLPDPDILKSETYVAPRNPIEEKLTDIWARTLRIDKELIGIDANFFEIGGHSLSATVIITQIHRELTVKVPLLEVFKRVSIRNLAQYIKDAEKEVFDSIGPVEEREYYPLSPGQNRLYILQQMDPDNTAYNMPQVVRLKEKPGMDYLNGIFRKLIKRHESLRTSFVVMDGKPAQGIRPDVPFEIISYDMNAGDNRTFREITREFVYPFDLTRAPLLRAGLVRTPEDHYILLIDKHHIITDGVSLDVLEEDFAALYMGRELEPLTIRYRDYSQWQNSEETKAALKIQETYWLSRFEGEIPLLNMPTDYPRPAVQSFEGKRINFTINAEQSALLKKLSLKEESTTMFMVTLAVFNVFLSKICNQNDIIVGTPIAGRRHSDLERVIGMFVNTLVLRNSPEGNKSFTGFLDEVRQRALEAFENQEYQFEDLVELVNVDRDTSRNPLFDVVFTYQAVESEGLAEEPAYKYVNTTSKFDLILHAVETAKHLSFTFEYCSKLFKEETMRRFIDYFKKTVSHITAAPAGTLSGIEVISDREKQRLLFDLNDTGAGYPKDKTIHGLFREQSERTPENSALVEPSQPPLTYRRLNRESDRLEKVLITRGVKPGTIVGIMVGRSVNMIVGVLAILKAGAAYLPIDPEYPAERISYMLRDSAAPVLVAPKEHMKQIEFKGLCIDPGEPETSEDRTHLPEPLNLPGHPAYIIYTSGTTGKPKGTVIEHKHVVRLLFNDRNLFDFNPDDVWTLFHSYCFDFSVWEMYGALLYGGKLVIIPGPAARDTPRYLDILVEEGVTVLNQTPSAFYNLSDEALNRRKPELKVRVVIFGGEALKPARLKSWKTMYPCVTLVNMYGITETTVHVTFKEIGAKEIESGIGNIGKPIPTLTTYIMDEHLKLVPPGVAGELTVGGEGVGRGYLNRPELTREKFVTNPYKPGERLYKSGDLVKLTGNGEMEYFGRIDQQVKIRGYRIELGEIENRLLEHEAVGEAVVLPLSPNTPAREKESGDHQALCAYIVSESPLGTAEVKDHLSVHLPDYMIPTYVVSLESIPLTSNKKVNRRALPEPRLEASGKYRPPENRIEEQLVGLWSEVLGLEPAVIGIDDNFFDLGGHSLKATLLLARVHKELNIKIPLVEIFRIPTVRELGKYISRAKEDKYTSLLECGTKEYYRISSVQRRLFFLQQMDPGNKSYNIPLVTRLDGFVEKEHLEAVFQRIIDRHESFRTSFVLLEGDPLQKISPTVPFELKYYEVRDESEDVPGILADYDRPYDLERAPLMRAGLIKVGVDEHILVINFHHIIFDGVSLGIFVRELMTLFQGDELPPLKLQYKDFAEWQNSETQQALRKKQGEFWLNEFEGELPLLNLPIDFDRPEMLNFEGSHENFVVDSRETRELKALAADEGATLYMVLLAVYNVLLSKLSGQEDIIVGTSTAGREHSDLQPVIGMFVNAVVLRNYPTPGKTFRQFLREVKRRTLAAFENQDFQFEDLVDRVVEKRTAGRNPIFDVMFVLNNEEIDKIEIPSLTLRPYAHKNKTAQMDLKLRGVEVGENIAFSFEYSTQLFKKKTMQALADHFKSILSRVLENKDIILEDITLAYHLLDAKPKSREIEFGF